jgi:hypothetical protein
MKCTEAKGCPSGYACTNTGTEWRCSASADGGLSPDTSIVTPSDGSAMDVLDVVRLDGIGSEDMQIDAVALDSGDAPTDAPTSEIGTAFDGAGATNGQGGSGGSGGASGGGGSGGWDGADAPIGGSIDMRGMGGGGASGLPDGGVTGDGGIMGLGGSTSAGGNTSIGGVTASGGTTTSGGVTTSGGATGSGGSTGSGGTTASGGATSATGGSSSASGGATTSGGATGSGGSTGGQSAGGSTGSGGAPVPSNGCGTATLAHSGEGFPISVNGTNRTYNLQVPSSYDTAHPYRLIVSYHWMNAGANDVSRGDAAEAQPWYGLSSLANGSTIFVAPQGIGDSWAQGSADVAFSRQLITQLENTLCVDKSRIFAEGFSMGGAMAYAMACAMGDTLRAVAVHSGGPMSGCVAHSTPVPYFMTHGNHDSSCTYPQYGVPQLLDFAKLDGCTNPDPTQTPTSFAALVVPTDQSGNIPACVDFAGCSPGYPVRACIFYGEHTASPGGLATTWVPAETWTFLSQF